MGILSTPRHELQSIIKLYRNEGGMEQTSTGWNIGNQSYYDHNPFTNHWLPGSGYRFPLHGGCQVNLDREP
jgi:hypothetical protein